MKKSIFVDGWGRSHYTFQNLFRIEPKSKFKLVQKIIKSYQIDRFESLDFKWVFWSTFSMNDPLPVFPVKFSTAVIASVRGRRTKSKESYESFFKYFSQTAILAAT